jgi:hypothetical protein
VSDVLIRRVISILRGSRLQELATNFLPGLLAGAQIAGLLFFLNPHLPFGWWPLLRTGAVLGLYLGVGSGIVLSYFTWSRPGLAQRLLPWTITAVLVVAAVVDWTQASYLAFFVPPGVNQRLIKAAAGLTVAALLGFYTALLHTVPRRPYRRRYVVFLVVLSLASVYFLAERREAFKPPILPTPRPSAVELDPGLNLILVGLEGASLDAILPMAEQGQLPFFAKLIEEGAYGRLSPLSPTFPEALWTTLAAGRFPYKHGILGSSLWTSPFLPGNPEFRLLPAGPLLPDHLVPGLRRRSADADLRSALALWEIFDRLQLPSGVVGWPATFPVRRVSAFTFSDRYFSGVFSAAAALPPELAERGVFFRVASEELDPDAAAAFGDEVPMEILRVFTEDVWRETLTLFLMDQRQELRSLFLLLPGLGEASRLSFGGYSSFLLGGRQEKKGREAAQILTAYYRHLDSFLSQLWERPPGAKILAVVSPFGVTAPTGWRRLWMGLSRRSVEGSYQPTSDGVFFLLGSGVRANHFLSEAGVLDVMPTLLYGVGLPISRDLDGRVLITAFDSAFLAQTPLTFVPSYETLARETPPAPESPPAGAQSSP